MTIKTQGGKVITKDGKVSCECCGDCCMYPALPLINEEYSWDDLPDAINYGDFDQNTQEFTVIFTLQKQTQGNSDPFDGKERVYYFEEETIFGIERHRILTEYDGDIGWILEYYDGEWFPTASEPVEKCLFGEQQGEELFSDFAQSYSVSGPVSGIIGKLLPGPLDPFFDPNCRYRGVGLFLTYNSTTYKWQLNGNPKIGFQNTPAGLYEGGYSVS